MTASEAVVQKFLSGRNISCAFAQISRIHLGHFHSLLMMPAKEARSRGTRIQPTSEWKEA